MKTCCNARFWYIKNNDFNYQVKKFTQRLHWPKIKDFLRVQFAYLTLYSAAWPVLWYFLLLSSTEFPYFLNACTDVAIKLPCERTLWARSLRARLYFLATKIDGFYRNVFNSRLLLSMRIAVFDIIQRRMFYLCIVINPSFSVTISFRPH